MAFTLDLTLIFLLIILLFPVVLIIQAALVFFLMRSAQKKEKFSWRNFFWPFSSQKSIGENISELFVNPAIWVFELTLAALVILLVLIIDLLSFSLPEALLIFLAGGAVALSFPAFYTICLWALDYKRREPLRIIFSLFVWGMATAFFAIIISLIFQIPFALAIPNAIIISLISAVIIAPIVEESIKGFGLLIICFNKEMGEGIVDGLLYGAVVGLGFAFVENWMYFSMNITPPFTSFDWVSLALLRSCMSAVGHATFTGANGAVLGFLKGRGFKLWWLGIIPGLLVAMTLHGTFNFFASTIDGIISMLVGLPLPLFAGSLVGISVLVLGGTYVLCVLGQKVETALPPQPAAPAAKPAAKAQKKEK